jgi:hypothetical protein
MYILPLRVVVTQSVVDHGRVRDTAHVSNFHICKKDDGIFANVNINANNRSYCWAFTKHSSLKKKKKKNLSSSIITPFS